MIIYLLAKTFQKVYKRLDENDVFEWGDINFESHLKSFRYRIRNDHNDEIVKIYGKTTYTDEKEKEITFHDALFPQNYKNCEEDKVNEKVVSSILILGCGNSRLGEDILHYYLDIHADHEKEIAPMTIPLVTQCDISTHVVNSMTKRYHKYIENNQMSIIQDDATQFTLIEDESMDAVVDKGLVDALFCSDQGEMIQKVMKGVHRTLKMGKVFMFFSFSKPEYILKDTKFDSDESKDKMQITNNNKPIGDGEWSSINVWELDQIFLYRFVKAQQVTEKHSLKGNQMKFKKKKA